LSTPFPSSSPSLSSSPSSTILLSQIPEDLNGAGRNWDYRYAWIRDASFTVYALLRLGFTEEADQYVDWLSGLLRARGKGEGLQIMCVVILIALDAVTEGERTGGRLRRRRPP